MCKMAAIKQTKIYPLYGVLSFIKHVHNYILNTQTTFKGRVFMTPATKAIYRWLLSDYIKVSNISSDHMLYNEKDLEKSMDKIEIINFHQVRGERGRGRKVRQI